MQFPSKFLTVFKRRPNSLFLSLTGIAPITVVTHCDKLKKEEDREEALEAAYKATNSSPSHTFLTWNYTKDNTERNLEIERMIFDILHYALITAEKAVKQMKHRERNEREDEMMKALEGTSVSGQVAPDSPDGNMTLSFHRRLPSTITVMASSKTLFLSICYVSPCLELKSTNCGQRSVDSDSLFFQSIRGNF